MSLLIKGMEMPKSCGDCNFYYVDYEEGTASCLATSCYVQPHHYHKDNRDPDCPLVEIPTPHGRLIDADILLDAIRYGAEVRDFCNKKCKSQDCQNCVIKAVYKIIREVPTIIEAER